MNATHAVEDSNIAILATTHKIYPKFHFFPCYYISNIDTLYATCHLSGGGIVYPIALRATLVAQPKEIVF